MDLLVTHPRLEKQSSNVRARRIRDEEWEFWRDTLTRLYVEDDESRKSLTDIMAKEHQFIVNERQLKHIFRKWGVKKHIPDGDMTAMLSFRSKRQAAGDHVTFEYRGHEVEYERIERAAKRRKRSLPPTQALPAHITASISSGSFLHQESASPGLSSENWEKDQVLSAPSELGNVPESTVTTDEMVQGVQDLVPEKSCNTSLALELDLSPPATSLDWAFIDLNTVAFDKQSDTMAVPRPTPPFHSQRDFQFDSPRLSEIDWSCFVNSPLSRPQTGVEPSQDIESPLQDLSSLSAAVIPQSTSDHDFPDPEGSSPIAMLPTALSTGQMAHIGEHALVVMLPLQLLYSHFHAYLKTGSVQRSGFGEHAPHEFLAVVRSEWSCRQLDNLLCWAFENAASSIRQRQQPRTNRQSSNSKFQRSRFVELHEESALEEGWQAAETKGRAKGPTKLKSNLLLVTQTGTLMIHLRTPLVRNSMTAGPETLRLSFMPATNERTIGVTVSFDRYSCDVPMPNISPSIKTFNIVPQDSDIIQRITCNDLAGVRRLFDRGEASPLDVDPYGFSLLSYAIKSGGSEIFLLLLCGGADTQNCDHYGSALDIVWSIWFQYVDHISHAKPSSTTLIPPLGDINECFRVTDAVLDRDYDLEESVCYNSDRANVLFEMNESTALNETNSKAAREVLDFLINKGYDIEKRNDGGLTPLLHAVSSYKPQSLECLKTFIRRGANINARNMREQSALHIALAGPYRLLDWKYVRFYAETDVETYYWTLQLVYHTDLSTDDRRHEHWDIFGSAGVEAQSPDTDFSQLQEANEGGNVSHGQHQACADNSSFEGGIPEYVLCTDYDGVEHLIRSPMRVLQGRLECLLLTLLEAGCDPNVTDGDNESPNSYARRGNVWPQWSSALEKSGYRYETEKDHWVRVATPKPPQTIG